MASHTGFSIEKMKGCFRLEKMKGCFRLPASKGDPRQKGLGSRNGKSDTSVGPLYRHGPGIGELGAVGHGRRVRRPGGRLGSPGDPSRVRDRHTPDPARWRGPDGRVRASEGAVVGKWCYGPSGGGIPPETRTGAV